MSAFERWWASDDSARSSQTITAKASRNAAIAEMSQPQSSDTCPKGHPVWALVPDVLDRYRGTKKGPSECSICAAVEAERKRVVEEAVTFIENVHLPHTYSEVKDKMEITRLFRAHFAGKEEA